MASILALLKLIPAIIALVQEAEAAFPGAGTGPAKLDFVLSILKAVEAVEIDTMKLVSLIGVIASKLFTKHSQPA